MDAGPSTTSNGATGCGWITSRRSQRKFKLFPISGVVTLLQISWNYCLDSHLFFAMLGSSFRIEEEACIQDIIESPTDAQVRREGWLAMMDWRRLVDLQVNLIGSHRSREVLYGGILVSSHANASTATKVAGLKLGCICAMHVWRPTAFRSPVQTIG